MLTPSPTLYIISVYFLFFLVALAALYVVIRFAVKHGVTAALKKRDEEHGAQPKDKKQ